MQGRTTDEKVELYGRFFIGRRDVYGTYDPGTGRVWQVKNPVTKEVLFRHLKGIQPYGIYLLDTDRTPAAVVDFDHDECLLPFEFTREVRSLGMSAYIERSKSKGYHVWMFFARGRINALKARLVIKFILDEIGVGGDKIDHWKTETSAEESWAEFWQRSQEKLQSVEA